MSSRNKKERHSSKPNPDVPVTLTLPAQGQNGKEKAELNRIDAEAFGGRVSGLEERLFRSASLLSLQIFMI